MLRKLIPRMQVKTVYEIPLQQLWDSGIRGIITDLDNTLVGAGVPLASPELVEWLGKVKERGFQVVIVSNNHRARVSRFAEPIALPFIYKAKKPFNIAFRRAMEIMGLSSQQTAMVGDQMLTDVLGGNRLGLFTILVQPIALHQEGFMTRINRKLEKAALSVMKAGGRGHVARRRR